MGDVDCITEARVSVVSVYDTIPYLILQYVRRFGPNAVLLYLVYRVRTYFDVVPVHVLVYMICQQ